MLASARAPLRAPGVYPLPDRPVRALHAQRMDVCAFAGVAPRGPAFVPRADEKSGDMFAALTDPKVSRLRTVPVRVGSFDEYTKIFGGFEGPGRLPHAVAAFFEQGGREAVVIRIVADTPESPPPNGKYLAGGVLVGQQEDGKFFTAELAFVARNRGEWGNRIRIDASFQTVSVLLDADGAGRFFLSGELPAGVAVGAVFRLFDPQGHPGLYRCADLVRVPEPGGPGVQWNVVFEMPRPAFVPDRAELVELRLEVTDGAGNVERFDRLGLSLRHPRGVAPVLCNESAIVWPSPAWANADLDPASAAVETLRGATVRKNADGVTETTWSDGQDDYSEILADHFFDSSYTPAETEPASGIAAVASAAGVTHLLVPDLYVPLAWAGVEQAPPEPKVGAGAEFAPCIDAPEGPRPSSEPPSLVGLVLDPRTRAGLDAIVALQGRVVEFCEQTKDHIVLLDVPPGLSQGQVERWRSRFDSTYAAAYHPWFAASRRAPGPEAIRDSDGTVTERLPPSAVAAGIIARKERRYGIQHGPANEEALELVRFAEPSSEPRVAALHPFGLNGFLLETSGIRLTGARTLSRERDYRQLSVRRLVLMLRRTLLVETQWAVFEPNGPKLWGDLAGSISALLLRLFRAGAFAGATPAESYFVRVLEDPRLLDLGQLVVEVGVAPVEPIEFILLRLARAGDGPFTVEEV